MAYDRKYGRVTTEHGTLGEDEPVVVFRGRDRLLPEVLRYYQTLCGAIGSPQRHLDIIDGTISDVDRWQSLHHREVRTPDSKASREWLSF